LGLAQEVND